MAAEVTVLVRDESRQGGKVTLLLYAHDKSLADASATKICSAEVQVPEDGQVVTVKFTPDLDTCEQAGKKWSEMNQPSMYVAIDVQNSQLTYSQSPLFGLCPNQCGELVLKGK
mmetsp:Transcript_8836/g.11132  ORF Transcript_8836/g.11132 Transcript_8836/m.11132 type:complete len:113 (+) Transcript_8836:264-602(+)|eukprot:CAMPEP_0204829430 /NCGR_PEP_ID=MMETSP1346-20131115/7593_1 /ASSEMBLY_ACC=CAM_ASM_000771 /TAXON_ID=215587 /ORGANISM="Aplanochytrium stocchinoi, Strain GSBS06" /LENGTH=112 /DNA_ID=CAMNT_0051959203 /DNA_START=148 /DNA_END=486 /DNA_ORIENTATION=-